MHTAYVCLDPGVPVLGTKGSSLHCQEIIRCFLELNFKVHLLGSRLGCGGPLANLSNPFFSANQLCKQLSKNPTEREQELLDLNLAVRTSLQKMPSIPEMVYERFSLWSYSAMEFAQGHGITGVLEVNSPLIEEQKKHRTLSSETQAMTAQRRSFAAATALVAVSEEVGEYLQQFPEARGKTMVVPNGVNAERFQKLPGSLFQQSITESVVVGFVGSLKPWHGVDRLISAFATAFEEQPALTLQIVGDGPERHALEQQINRLPQAARNAIQLLGHVSYDQMPTVLNGFDIAVAPYPDLANFYFSPLKILEYMAAGCAIVASDIGQIRDLISDHSTGLLAVPGSDLDLASGLLLLAQSPELREQLGAAARQQALTHHRWEQVTDKILSSIDLPARREVVT